MWTAKVLVGKYGEKCGEGWDMRSLLRRCQIECRWVVSSAIVVAVEEPHQKDTTSHNDLDARHTAIWTMSTS
jgi:hypothetical protein